MVDCVVKDWEGQQAGTATLDLRVAKEETAAHVVHRALVRQMNNARQGTASSKTRSEVSGGVVSPGDKGNRSRSRWFQPLSLWRGGGVIFGPKPRDYSVKINRKERRLALRTAIQSRATDLIVVEDFVDHLPRPKTKELVQALARWGVDPQQKVLLIVAERNDTVYLSARNIGTLKLISANNLNIFDLLAADKIVATASAIAKVQEVYGA